MLARVGGDVDMVCKLKAALTSRQRGHRKKPLLVRWVDGWLEWLNENQPFLQVAERKVKIDEETSAIREARKIAQKAKKGKKPKDFQEKNRNPFGDENRIESPKPRSHHEKSREPFEYDRRIESAKPKNHHETRRNPHDDGKRIKSPESPEPKNHHGKSRDPYDDGKRIKSPDPEEELEAPDEIPEPTGRDFENSIIDHYGALMSTTHLPTHADGSRWQFSCAPRPEDEGHVHLAFRNRPEASDRRDSTKRAAGGAGTQAKEYQALLPDRERTQTLNRRGSTRPGTNGAVVTNQEYVPPRRDWKKIETPSREGSTRSGAETTPKNYPTPSQKMEKIETPQRRGITRPATRGEVANTEEHKIRPPNGERAKSSARERATDSTTVTSWENLYNGQK